MISSLKIKYAPNCRKYWLEEIILFFCMGKSKKTYHIFSKQSPRCSFNFAELKYANWTVELKRGKHFFQKKRHYWHHEISELTTIMTYSLTYSRATSYFLFSIVCVLFYMINIYIMISLQIGATFWGLALIIDEGAYSDLCFICSTSIKGQSLFEARRLLGVIR